MIKRIIILLLISLLLMSCEHIHDITIHDQYGYSSTYYIPDDYNMVSYNVTEGDGTYEITFIFKKEKNYD